MWLNSFNLDMIHYMPYEIAAKPTLFGQLEYTNTMVLDILSQSFLGLNMFANKYYTEGKLENANSYVWEQAKLYMKFYSK